MTIAVAVRAVLIAACLGFSGDVAAQTGKADTVAPGGVSPETDARGIPVISDTARAPAGWNQPGIFGRMSADFKGKLKPCTRSLTDRCLQTYEKERLGRLPRCPGHPSCSKPED